MRCGTARGASGGGIEVWVLPVSCNLKEMCELSLD